MRSLLGILQGRPSIEEAGSASTENQGSPVLAELAETFAEDEMVIPSLRYEKSFLRKIPSIILEAHESIISLKNDEAPPKKGLTEEGLADFFNQVHQESARSGASGPGTSAAEEAYSSQNATSQRRAVKKDRSHLQQKFFEKSACFDVPSAQDVPVDLFD